MADFLIQIIMNKINLIAFLLFLFSVGTSLAQEQPKLTYKLSGFVRSDFCFDTRLSASANEGLFFLYPLNVSPDANGKDLNAIPYSGFHSFNTRVGLDIGGLKVFDANVSAKVEADFAGYSNSSTLLRIRRAFMTMKWENSSLLIGQEWHPMFGGVIPTLLSLNTGAPFNPFNRSPQINYNYKSGNVTLTAAALWQFQYHSIGPDGKTPNYQRNANVPEFSAAIDFKHDGIVLGALADYLTLRPRTSFIGSDQGIYKADERLSSFSYGAYAGYSSGLFSVKAKSIVGENLSDMAMHGGFGVTKIDATTGEQEYTNFKHSSSWLNLTYGKKYQGGVFAGYTKNLGSNEELHAASKVYGDGMGINELYRLCGTFTYNIPNFTIGLEYEFTNAAYGEGSRELSDGLFKSTHNVNSHRILGVICYYF